MTAAPGANSQTDAHMKHLSLAWRILVPNESCLQVCGPSEVYCHGNPSPFRLVFIPKLCFMGKQPF